ncbi:MAG: hypothetical protein WD048_07785 [Chitinophagales bacterium]
MKRQLSKILIFPTVILLFTHVFNERIIQLAFDLNQDFIKNELCIKKDTPGNSCLGACYFSDQMEKEQERKESPEYLLQKEVFYLSNTLENKFAVNTSIKKRFFLFNENYTAHWNPSLFRPPSAFA